MTAFSFIMGVFPLVIAEGAGAASRQAIGTTVFSGHAGRHWLVGIFIIPALYRRLPAAARPPKSPGQGKGQSDVASRRYSAPCAAG